MGLLLRAGDGALRGGRQPWLAEPVYLKRQLLGETDAVVRAGPVPQGYDACESGRGLVADGAVAVDDGDARGRWRNDRYRGRIDVALGGHVDEDGRGPDGLSKHRRSVGRHRALDDPTHGQSEYAGRGGGDQATRLSEAPQSADERQGGHERNGPQDPPQASDRHVEKGTYHLGVELTAGPIGQLLAGGRDGPGRLVGADGGHGVEGVGHRHDSGPEADLLTGQSGRVAGAVETLVVVEDGLGPLSEEIVE